MESTTSFKRATLDELFVERDESGEVRPIEVASPLFGRTFLIVPLTYAHIKADDVLSKPIVDWPFERKAQILRDCMHTPSFKALDDEKLRANLDPMSIDHMLTLIMVKSSPFLRLQKDVAMASPLETMTRALRDQVREQRRQEQGRHKKGRRSSGS